MRLGGKERAHINGNESQTPFILNEKGECRVPQEEGGGGEQYLRREKKRAGRSGERNYRRQDERRRIVHRPERGGKRKVPLIKGAARYDALASKESLGVLL